MAKMTGHRTANPDASLASATLVARGVTSDHTLELNGTTLSKQPVRLVASGGWRADAAQKYGWRGTLIAAESGKPLELRLSEPTPVAIGQGRSRSGPHASTHAAHSFPQSKFSCVMEAGARQARSKD